MQNFYNIKTSCKAFDSILDFENLEYQVEIIKKIYCLHNPNVIIVFYL